MTNVVYTEEQKAEALALYEEHGAASAARLVDFDISPGTLRVWAHRAGLKRYDSQRTAEATAASVRRQLELREEFKELLLAKGTDMLLRMDEPTIDYRGKDATKVVFDRPSPRDCQALMTAAVIAIQNFRLENGEPTGRTETLTLTAGLLESEIQRLEHEVGKQAPADI